MSRPVKRKRGENAIRRQVHHCIVMALALRLEVRIQIHQNTITHC